MSTYSIPTPGISGGFEGSWAGSTCVTRPQPNLANPVAVPPGTHDLGATQP